MVQRVNIFRGCSYSKDIVVLNDFEIPYLEDWSDIECWESAWKSFGGSCELLSLNLILTLYNQWANFVQTIHTCKSNSFCTSRVTFIAKTDMPSPVDCASGHKIIVICTSGHIYCVQTLCKLCVNCTAICWLAVTNKLKVKFYFGDKQKQRETRDICTSKAASSQLKTKPSHIQMN